MPDLPATPNSNPRRVSFQAAISSGVPILGEGSMYERLRRDPAVEFDPHIAHAGLIYDPASARVMEETHREYLDIGQKYGLPMVAATATWRANAERISQSRFRNKAVNQDNVAFMRDICASYGASAAPIFIDAIVGPKGDAYRPQEAPGRVEAERFHAYQIEALAETDVDQLIAMTLPAFDEAFALATLMAQTTKPYMLSFVIRKNGRLLDGTPFRQVIQEIDATVARPPAGYGVNCVHPRVFAAGLQAQGIIGTSLAERIFGLCANTSAREPEELDGLDDLDTEEPEAFATSMWETYASAGSKYLGGCCGTTTAHIEAIARKWSSQDQD